MASASDDIQPVNLCIPGIECGVVTWPIKSYQVLKDIHEMVISPEFSIGHNSPFRFRFTISPRKDHPDRYLVFTVRSCVNQSENENLRAKVYMTINGSVTFGNRTLVWAEEETHDFNLGEVRILPNIDLQECYQRCCPMDFVITCEIIFWFKVTTYPFEEKQHLIDLSEDFYRIFKDGRCPDRTLLLESGGKIKAHRSILSARSEQFRAILESRTGPKIRISGFLENVMRQVFGYLYSGNFRSLKSGFIHSSVCKCAEQFGMLELCKILQQSKIILNDVKEGETIECRWTFRNFSMFKDFKKIELQSVVFHSASKKLSWCGMRLCLVKNENDNNGIPYVELLCLGDGREVNAYTRLAVLTSKLEVSRNYIHNTAPTYGSFGRVSLSKLFKSDASPFPDDCITVYANVTLTESELKRERFVEKKVLLCNNKVLGDCFLTKFSSDMENLLKTGLHSDFKIITKEKQFKVHRAILTYRDSDLQRKVRSAPSSVSSISVSQSASQVEKTLYRVYTGRNILNIK